MREFIINGKEYKVNFGHNALVAIEDKLGKSISEIGDVDFSAKQIQVLFYAGLLGYQRGMTFERAGDEIDKVEDYSTFVTELMNEFAESLMKRFNTAAEATEENTSKKK